MDRYEIGIDVSGTEPAEDFKKCTSPADAIVLARELQTRFPKRNVYIFDRLPSWRQVQAWHYVDGELIPISWRS